MMLSAEPYGVGDIIGVGVGSDGFVGFAVGAGVGVGSDGFGDGDSIGLGDSFGFGDSIGLGDSFGLGDCIGLTVGFGDIFGDSIVVGLTVGDSFKPFSVCGESTAAKIPDSKNKPAPKIKSVFLNI